MRKLPIYFLIDVSESMVGDPILRVEEGMASIIKAIKTDPHAIETVWISIIVFAGQPKTLVPLQEIVNFYPPKFPIGGGTSFGSALGHLMFELRKNTVKTTMEVKGDWKPIVFLFTDGVPTDDATTAISEWKKNWTNTANMVAISFGEDTDVSLLKELTEDVLIFKNSTNEDYSKFFKWVTDSIKTSSVSVENSKSGFELAKLDGETIKKLDPREYPAQVTKTDPNFVVLSAKCQNAKRPYLIKYRKVVNPSDFSYLNLNTMSYRLVGGFQVDQSYYDLSDESSAISSVNSSELVGSPSCPCCGNQYGFAMCSCGKLMCIDGPTGNTCPWCESKIDFGNSSNEGFDVNRTLG